MDLLFAQLPMEIAMQIVGYPLPLFDEMTDKLIGSHTSNGVFTAKSAYDAIQAEEGENGQRNLAWLWRLPAPSRWVHFCFLVWMDRLLTNELRFKWGLADSPMCSRCSSQVEDTLHVLCDCIEARKVWRHFLTSSLIHDFFTCDIEDWLLKNLYEEVLLESPGKDFRCYFLTIICRLWTTRCNLIFRSNEDDIPVTEYALIRNIEIRNIEEVGIQPRAGHMLKR